MNHIQDYFIFWRQVSCPKCNEDNWIYDSHSLRHYPRIPNGCKCYNCDNKFFIGDLEEFEVRYSCEIEEYGIDKTIEEYLDYDTGKASPIEN